MNGIVRQVQPSDSTIAEEWERTADERRLSAASASKHREGSWWWVNVPLMEFVRTDPLASELRDRIAEALSNVRGVTSVEEEEREVWFVAGTPTGETLVEAVAHVLDDMSDRTRAVLDALMP
ncbi:MULTISPECIES: hypothetical protein [Streptomyces]|uniref:hypothetical protein n=1 Tax=Streptomyces TaxID=1883 RepID=UPI00159282F7|nr:MULTISPECIES: hypothetical protein [Streptomyces]QKV71508.1 hypothetical protein HUT13_24080 [Streptomyces harbinensis]